MQEFKVSLLSEQVSRILAGISPESSVSIGQMESLMTRPTINDQQSTIDHG